MKLRTGWEGHVAGMELRNVYNILVENLKGRDYSEDVDVDGIILIELILEKYGDEVRTRYA
jgi:hypothetical protein